MALTKNDLVKIKDVVLEAVEPMMIASQKEFAKIDDKFAKIDGEIKEKFDKVLTGQDKILKGIEDLKSEQTADTAVHKRQDGKLENHEVRIIAIEKKLNIVKIR